MDFNNTRSRSIHLPSGSQHLAKRSRNLLLRRGSSNDDVSLSQSSSAVPFGPRANPLKPSRNSSAAKRNSASINDSEMLSDAGQKVRSGGNSNATSSQQQRGSRSSVPVGPSGSQPMKKDKGKERAHSLNKPADDEPWMSAPTFSGPIAAAEFDRMRREIESLRNTIHDHKKTIKKQAKKIEDLKVEVNEAKAAKSEKEAQLRSFKAKQVVNDELVNSVEVALQCQICMDLLSKPFALSPCGHILCLVCLQAWFRKAPPSLDDADIDPEEVDDPEYIKYRTKSCPCCRAVVVRRPVPVFLVKNILTAFQKAKAPIGGGHPLAHQSSSPFLTEEDPWEGIFPDTDDESRHWYSDSDEESGWSGDEEGRVIDQDEDMTEEEYNESMNDMDDDESMIGMEDYGEEDSDEEDYIDRQWEPPLYDVDGISARGEQLKLRKRGCSQWMSRVYRMRYTHDSGLVAHLNSLDEQDIDILPHGPIDRMHRLFLGWNISDMELDGEFVQHFGKAFIRETLSALKLYPHRFRVIERSDGQSDVHLLVKADEAIDYDTTDSERWL